MLAVTLGITEAMKNNENFKNPIPSLKSIEKATQNYTDSLKVVLDNPTKLDVLTKNKNSKELRSLLTKLAKYVNLVADGDLYKLKSSGFKIAKKPSTIGVSPEK
ncbi:MAG: hypothetical protein GQ570_09405 [Helicobacteraceae bacterium]|nr:hypothetical protein [Helicobacteraceae bacterium]